MSLIVNQLTLIWSEEFYDTNSRNIHLEKKNYNLIEISSVQTVEDNILYNNNRASDKCLNPGSSEAFTSLYPRPTYCDKQFEKEVVDA